MGTFRFLTWLCLSLIAGGSAGAAVTGVVRAGKIPVPGATVVASQGDRKIVTTTDDQGRYSLDLINPGAWTVEVQMFGFATAKKEVAQTASSQDWELALATRPVTPTRGAPNGQGFQRLALAAAQTGNTNVNTFPAPPPEQPLDTAGGSSESFLVNGSLSRGLQAPSDDTNLLGPPGGEFGGGPGGRNGLETDANGAAGGAPGFGGAGGGGFGGGGGRGGFGGGGGGGFGGRGGGPGGPGGRGNMTPERARAMRERMRNGNPMAFGNRQGRGRQQVGVRGAVFYQFSNSALDARQFSLTGQPNLKPSYGQNRVGLNLGGPLKIPHLLKGEQTFFFLNYTGVLGRNPYNAFATVPTLLERSGDFSQSFTQAPVQIYDPLTRQPFPNNRVPASRLNSAALGLLSYIPLPNQPGSVQNYRYVTSFPQETHSLNMRLNQTINAKHRLSGSVNFQKRESDTPQLYGFQDVTSGQGLSADLGWTWNFGKQTISNAHVTFNRNSNDLLPFFAYGTNVAAAVGIIGTSPLPINYGPPNLNFTNFGSLSDGSALLRHNQTFGLNETIQMVRGAHTLSVGVDWKRVQINAVTDQNARGTYSFNGLATSGFDANGQPLANTGYDFADYLLGLPQSSSIRFGSSDTYFRSSQYAAFVQDNWRARPNLSFSLGLRYEYVAPFHEKYGRIANLDIAPAFAGVAVVTPNQPGPYSGSFPSSLVNPDYNNLSPRLGFSWRPFKQSRLQVRGGYSLFYDTSVYARFITQFASQPPFGNTGTLVTSADRPLTIQNGFAVEQSKQITNTYAVDRNYRLPYAQTYSLSVEQQVRGFVVELGYLATKGTRLDVLRLPNRAAPGSPLTAEQRRQIGNAVGFTYESSEGDSIFHAGQLRITRRLRRGVSANLLYTFSKSIDNASSIGGSGNIVAQNDRDLQAERGLSSFDQRHALTMSSLLTSPFGEQGAWLKSNGLASTLLREWTTTISLTARSGHPFTPRILGNLADTGGTGSVGSGRPDATGLPLYDGSGFLNPAAFTLPAPGAFGNAGRNTIIGPGTFSVSASFGRAFKVGNSDRKRIEFRVQGDNITNHVNYTSIATVVNASNFGLATATGPMRTLSALVRLRF